MKTQQPFEQMKNEAQFSLLETRSVNNFKSPHNKNMYIHVDNKTNNSIYLGQSCMYQPTKRASQKLTLIAIKQCASKNHSPFESFQQSPSPPRATLQLIKTCIESDVESTIHALYTTSDNTRKQPNNDINQIVVQKVFPNE
jgi:hypothetical protein